MKIILEIVSNPGLHARNFEVYSRGIFFGVYLLFVLQNFTILYIKTGYPRLSGERQAELVGSLIQCLDGKPPLQQDV